MRLKFLLILFLTCFTLSVKAKGIPVIYGDGPDVIEVADLPYTEEFEIIADNGQSYHAKLGILHEQFSLFWIPVWNYGTEKYVLYTDKKIGEYDFTYADLDKEDLQYIRGIIGGLPLTPELPFWDKYGGKLIYLFLLILIIYGYASKDN